MQRLRRLTLPTEVAEAFSSDSSVGAQREFHVELRAAATDDAHAGYDQRLREIEKFLCRTMLGDSGRDTKNGARWGLIDYVTIRLPLPFLKVCTLIDAPGFDNEAHAWRNRLTFDCMLETDIGTVVHVVEDRPLTWESKRPIENAEIPRRLASNDIKALVLCWPVDKDRTFGNKVEEAKTDSERQELVKSIGKAESELGSRDAWMEWRDQTGNTHWLDDNCLISVCSGEHGHLEGELSRFSVLALRKRLEQVARSQLAYECATKSLQLMKNSLCPYVRLQRFFLSIGELLDEDEISNWTRELEEDLQKKASPAKVKQVMDNIQSALGIPHPFVSPRSAAHEASAPSSGFASIAYGLNYGATVECVLQILDGSEVKCLLEVAKANSFASKCEGLKQGRIIAFTNEAQARDSESQPKHAKCFVENAALGRALKRSCHRCLLSTS